MVSNLARREFSLNRRRLGLSVPRQDQFLCLAVLQGRLKVFYDFSNTLVELSPKESSKLKISDADPKAVGSADRLFPVSSRLSSRPTSHRLVFLVCFSAGDHHPSKRP